MPGLGPGIHALAAMNQERPGWPGIGERSDAVLRTAMPGHDDTESVRLLQEQIRRGVGHARLLADVRLIAAARRRDAAGGRHAQDALGLVERARPFARLDVEEEPGDRARRRRRRG